MRFTTKPEKGMRMARVWKYLSKFHTPLDNALARPPEVTLERGNSDWKGIKGIVELI